MGLMVPKWGFQHHASRWTQLGVTGNSAAGLSITSGAANTKGSTSGILSAVDFDVHCIAIAFSGNNSSGVIRSSLVDIMFDPAGGTSWNVLVNNILTGQLIGLGQSASHQHIYIFPLYVKSGASFGARHQNSTASVAMPMHMWVWGEPTRPELWWCGSAVETLGANTGTSLGTSIQPGNGAWSSPATSPGTSGQKYGAYQLGIGPNDVYTANRNVVFAIMQASTGSVQKAGTDYFFMNASSTETMAYGIPVVPNFCDMASGTVIYVSGWAAAGTDTWATTFYGVY